MDGYVSKPIKVDELLLSPIAQSRASDGENQADTEGIWIIFFWIAYCTNCALLCGGQANMSGL